MAKKGHNSDSESLNSFVKRITNLKDEKDAVAESIKEVFAEAKANGFDNRTIREMIKLVALEAAERDERETLRDLYMDYLGIA